MCLKEQDYLLKMNLRRMCNGRESHVLAFLCVGRSIYFSTK